MPDTDAYILMLVGCFLTAWSAAVELLYGNMSTDENGQNWDGVRHPPQDIAHRFTFEEQLGGFHAYELTWSYVLFALLAAIGATALFYIALKLWEALFILPPAL
jgi:hypothetical protein